MVFSRLPDQSVLSSLDVLEEIASIPVGPHYSAMQKLGICDGGSYLMEPLRDIQSTIVVVFPFVDTTLGGSCGGTHAWQFRLDTQSPEVPEDSR